MVHDHPTTATRLATTAAADAQAAGVCASLLSDRIETLCQMRAAGSLEVGGMPGRLAEMSRAAERLQSAVARVFDTLDPELPPRVAAIADMERERTLARLTHHALPAPAVPHEACASNGEAR